MRILVIGDVVGRPGRTIVERELIRQALEVSEGNQSKAAKKLNLGIDAFRYRMKKFGYL